LFKIQKGISTDLGVGLYDFACAYYTGIVRYRYIGAYTNLSSYAGVPVNLG
jgi:hypothetical protein